VAEVNASLKQLTHGELGKSHVLFLSGLASAGDQACAQPVDDMGCLPIAPAPACGIEVAAS
jgi:hypothetical protein